MQLEGRDEEVKGLMRQSPAGNVRKSPPKVLAQTVLYSSTRARADINQGEQIDVGN